MQPAVGQFLEHRYNVPVLALMRLLLRTSSFPLPDVAKCMVCGGVSRVMFWIKKENLQFHDTLT